MNTPHPRRPSRAVKRVLLLPVGEAAIPVARRIPGLMQAWLHVEPPVALLPALGHSPAEDEWAQALDALFSQELVNALAKAGLECERPNELLLWLLVSLGPEQGTDLAPEQVQAAVEQLTEMAWQRLRVHITPFVLFLAEPTVQEQLMAWCTSTAQVWGPRLYVAGPVTHAHLRLPDEEWCERAATAAAALVLSDPPDSNGLRSLASRGEAAQAVGASVWVAPLAALRTYLAEAFARRVVERLHAPAGQTPAQDRLAPQLRGVEKEMTALLEGMPAPAMRPNWGARRPGLTALAYLPDSLRREVTQWQEQRQTALRKARRDWLAARLTEWQQALKRTRQEMLTPEQAWPSLQEYKAILQRRREEALRCEQEVEARLAEWGERLEQANHQVERATRRLQEVCELFPTADLSGVLHMLTHPWRVTRWAWAYFVWLPQAGQQLLDALARQSRTRWQEATWHTLRQLYLVMAQDMQLELASLEQIEEALAQVAQRLQAPGRVQVKDLAPWTVPGLEALGQRFLADDAACAWAFLAGVPLPTWPHETPEALADGLIQTAMPRLASLHGWTAVDCIVEALPGEALGPWLAQLAQLAEPLWPDEELRAERQDQSLLLLPPPAPESADPEQNARRQHFLESAAKPYSQAFVQTDAIGWLRFAPVDVNVMDRMEWG
ncbi:MAG: hypothetical protein D6790_20135 [Caldilineae bacterium]|nr:MAG: hypothetical protein D6790_20135 [Caldilineae bacterium]